MSTPEAYETYTRDQLQANQLAVLEYLLSDSEEDKTNEDVASGSEANDDAEENTHGINGMGVKLDQLGAELIGEICGYLENKEYRNFGLVNKRLSITLDQTMNND